MPECRSTILMDREAKRRRNEGIQADIYGPNELKTPRISLKEAARIWLRPFEMFVREPIVLCLSVLSGFSDAIIFIFLEGFSPVYDQWGFSVLAKAWAFIRESTFMRSHRSVLAVCVCVCVLLRDMC